MADYKDIVGTAVRNNAGTLTSAKTGELFYDSTALDFIYRHPNVTTAGAWRTGTAMNTARAYLFGGAGIQTAALAFGGNEPPGAVTAKTESYDGSTWTEVADLNDSRGEIAGSGTYTAALASGGNSPNQTANTEIWNGSGWTEVNDLNTARKSLAGAGTTTSTIVFGGYDGDRNEEAESWNGTSWTEVADLNSARNQLGGAGSSNTSALAFAGVSPSSPNAVTELWNGTAWTEVGDLNTARYGLGSGGTATSAIAAGGEPKTGKTELWNGTSWSEDGDLNVARQTNGATAASNASALAFGGDAPPGSPSYVADTEEFTGAGADIGAWGSGGNLNTARSHMGATGTQTATINFGGNISNATGLSEQYDGSAWTEVADLNSAREGLGAAGTYTCLLYTSPSPRDGLLSRMPSSA